MISNPYGPPSSEDLPRRAHPSGYGEGGLWAECVWVLLEELFFATAGSDGFLPGGSTLDFNYPRVAILARPGPTEGVEREDARPMPLQYH